MAHTKSSGSTSNLSNSQPKYLGIKLSDGRHARSGSIIVRQRGTVILPGKNVRCGRDHTLYSIAEGIVKFRNTTKSCFNGSKRKAKTVDVVV